MASSILDNLFGDFSGNAAMDHLAGNTPLVNAEKLVLAATAVTLYGVALVVFNLLGLPTLPNISSLLLQDQPFYAVFVAGAALIGLTLMARPAVGGVRYEAPLFCAAIGLLALPTHGGDFRNAALDAGGRGVFVRMIVELLLLTVAIAGAYLTLGLFRPTPVLDPDESAITRETPDADSAADRLAAVGSQAIIVLILLSLFGQSPLKGQALCGLALAGGLGGWITFKLRQVNGSVWPVAGTLLAGFAAYAWSYVRPDGIEIGDLHHAVAGAAYSLPLHYATAGVAGTIYGHWAGRSGIAGMTPSP